MTFRLDQTKPFENRRLPSELDLPHAVAMQFHDILAAIVVDLESANAFSASVELTPEDGEAVRHLQGEALWMWLRDNGHMEVIHDLTYRQLTAALISDACHFIIESLLACAKGKTAVAYTLLRKPFKENLLLLEWLAADPVSFLEHFHGETTYSYTPNRLSEEQRRRIITDCAALLGASPFVDTEFLYDVRFSKRVPYSLEQLWTKSTHLVTNAEGTATEPGNLNFVFSTRSAVREQWQYYYTIVPLLLAYFVAVAEHVVARFIDWKEPQRTFQLLLRTLALGRATEVIQAKPGKVVSGLVADIEEMLAITCTSCELPVSLIGTNTDRLWNTAHVQCAKCGETLDLWAALEPSSG